MILVQVILIFRTHVFFRNLTPSGFSTSSSPPAHLHQLINPPLAKSAHLSVLCLPPQVSIILCQGLLQRPSPILAVVYFVDQPVRIPCLARAAVVSACASVAALQIL
jgi:hypothetical protein